MNFVIDLFTNKIFLAPAAGWFIAQVAKIIIDTVKNGFDKERIAGGGGMPSSHSATVLGLITITGLEKGAGSFEFVMALFFGIVVMYDAMGVRLETQRQSIELNQLNKERENEGKKCLYNYSFREKLGHTVPEILVGMLIGIICGIVSYNLPL